MAKKVKNPISGRRITVGGTLHKRLCKNVKIKIAGCPEDKKKPKPKIQKIKGGTKEKIKINEILERFNNRTNDKKYLEKLSSDIISLYLFKNEYKFTRAQVAGLLGLGEILSEEMDKKFKPVPRKPKTIKIKIVKPKTIKIKIKTPIMPMPTKKDFETVIKEKIKMSLGEPVMYRADASVEPFFMLNLLKENKHDCSMPLLEREVTFSNFPRELFAVRAGKARITNIKPDDIKLISEKYLECEKKKKILVIPLSLPSHTNMLIFNTIRGEVERFEPHGSKTQGGGIKSDKINISVNKTIVNPLSKLLKKKLKFLPSNEVCPSLDGLQNYESEYKTEHKNIFFRDPPGFCTAWAYLYADLRIKFPEKPGSEIIEESLDIMEKEPKRLREFIRGQMRFLIEETDRAMKGSLRIFKDRKTVSRKDLYDKWDEYITREFMKYTS